MTQEQLATHLSITRQTVSKWELGESEPDIASLVRLSEIFGVTTDHLLKDVPRNTQFLATHTQTSKRARTTAQWLGGLLVLLGTLGTLTFWILSILHPADFGIGRPDGTHTLYTGLQGFLRTWNAVGLFWFTAAVGAVGLCLLFLSRRTK
ncbi:MAG: helix-turn-helix domain-containing protein [Oscillospiraceae bacterium]|nr:helix-turn-helix domain-containing protein [Oscillospiraceae bacterium]